MYKKPCCVFFMSLYGNKTNNTEITLNLQKNDLNAQVGKIKIINNSKKEEDPKPEIKTNLFYVVLVLMFGIILICVLVWLFTKQNSNLKKHAEQNKSERIEKEINEAGNSQQENEQNFNFFLEKIISVKKNKEFVYFDLLLSNKENKPIKKKCFKFFPFYCYGKRKIDNFFSQEKVLKIEWEKITEAAKNRYVFGDQVFILFEDIIINTNKPIKKTKIDGTEEIEENKQKIPLQIHSDNFAEAMGYPYLLNEIKPQCILNEKFEDDRTILITRFKQYFPVIAEHFFRQTENKIKANLESKTNITDFMLHIAENSPTIEEVKEWINNRYGKNF